MKLFARYFRVNLLATLVISILASIAFYFLLWFVMLSQVDQDLHIEQKEIETYVARYDRLPEPIDVKDQKISFEETRSLRDHPVFSTIRIPAHEHMEEFRQISFTLPVDNRKFEFKVSKSLRGTRHMNRSIIMISILTIMVILLVNILINRWQIRQLWLPFYSTLSQLQLFKLGSTKPKFTDSKIEEFTRLNHTLDQFISRAEREYTLLKEFTENASHELQTPLAITRSALDVLIQDENLLNTQGKTLQSAYHAIQKMSRLNQSLLLLAKIENQQFVAEGPIDFKKTLEDKLNDWQELWQAKSLSVALSLAPAHVVMNEQLADILLDNLLSNIARHTPEKGSIAIKLNEHALMIANSADGGPLPEDRLFVRFSKGGQPTDHHGLGLSIVKQIADVSALKTTYAFKAGTHIFTIAFR